MKRRLMWLLLVLAATLATVVAATVALSPKGEAAAPPSQLSSGVLDSSHGVVASYLAAVHGGDWAKVYGIADMSMRNGMTQAAFVAAMTKAEGSQGITGATATGTTTYTTNEAGASYARTPIRLTYGAGTSASTQDGTLVLVLDAGTWKVFTVE